MGKNESVLHVYVYISNPEDLKFVSLSPTNHSVKPRGNDHVFGFSL